MSDPNPMLEAYLNGELAEADLPAFNAWLREDPDHLRQWVLASFMSHELAEALAQEANTPEQPPVVDQAGAARQGVMDAEVLSLLEQIEAASHDAPLREIDAVQGEESTPSCLRSSESIELGAALRDLRWAAGKLARQWAVSKPAYLAYAAVVALLCVALFVDRGGEDAGPIAEWPPPDTAPGVETPSPFVLPVATLTAEYDAAWALQPGGDQRPGTIRPGVPLAAGQQLTLTQGFAEITTIRGAVAILEAPATVAFTDNNNAIRLLHGRLVGRCETESSKGFIVYAPSMEVVDLGTVFGVEVLDGLWTDVHVFDGTVGASRMGTEGREAGERYIIESGDAVRAEAGGSGFELMSARPIRFVRSLEEVQADRRAIASHFDQSEAEPSDQFNPRDGQGWAGPWQVRAESHSAFELSFEQDNPLGIGLGGYANAAFGMNENSPAVLENAWTSGILFREYDSFGLVDKTRPHVIRFHYRVDSELEHIALPRSQLAIFDGSLKDAEGKTWSLHAYPNPSDDRPVPTRRWLVVDGLPTGSTIRVNDPSLFDRMIDTGVELVSGKTYEFEIRVWPKRNEWDIVIRSDGSRYSSRETLGRPMRFRNSLDAVNGALQFEAYRAASPQKPCAVSIDEVTIEPLFETKESSFEND
ncbi:MAG: hypothetical protein AAGI37_13770 [Planctomycetota bacterium]